MAAKEYVELHLRVPASEYAALNSAAIRETRSVNGLVRHIIHAHVSNPPPFLVTTPAPSRHVAPVTSTVVETRRAPVFDPARSVIYDRLMAAGKIGRMLPDEVEQLIDQEIQNAS